MNFNTLQDTPINIIADVFHRAFQGYFVPLEMTEEKLRNKIKAERIDLELSVGTFDGDELVGFMLHARDLINGELTAYNAGTGVVPAHRGKQLTRKMYEYIVPKLKNAGVTNVLLEVIQQNAGAIKSYEQSGFGIVRELPCYRGTVSKGASEYIAEEIAFDDAMGLQEYFEVQPTWQNANNTIRDAGSATLCIKENHEPVACITYTPSTLRVHQLVVHHQYRRKGMGRALLQSITKDHAIIVVANIDRDYAPANELLKSVGLEEFVAQYEMQMRL